MSLEVAEWHGVMEEGQTFSVVGHAYKQIQKEESGSAFSERSLIDSAGFCPFQLCMESVIE